MIIFRTNASPSVGNGHLSRCRALAQELVKSGEVCIMFGPPVEWSIPSDAELFIKWIPCAYWSSSIEDAKKIAALAQENNVSWLILDDYRIDIEYQIFLKSLGLKWLQFDGAAQKEILADIIVNPNPLAKVSDYKNVLRNESCEFLLGPKYAVLRSEFENIELTKPNKSSRRMLVTFGGGNDLGMNEFVLSALSDSFFNQLDFIVLSGSKNPSNERLLEWVEKFGRGRVELHINPADVARLFSYCDVAVMAGGTSIYEALRCGIYPFIVSIAHNQKIHSSAWDSIGCGTYLGDYSSLTVRYLRQKVGEYLSRPDVRVFEPVVDGQGARRVVRSLLNG